MKALPVLKDLTDTEVEPAASELVRVIEVFTTEPTAKPIGWRSYTGSVMKIRN